MFVLVEENSIETRLDAKSLSDSKTCMIFASWFQPICFKPFVTQFENAYSHGTGRKHPCMVLAFSPLEVKYLAKHEDASSGTKLNVESVSALLE